MLLDKNFCGKFLISRGITFTFFVVFVLFQTGFVAVIEKSLAMFRVIFGMSPDVFGKLFWLLKHKNDQFPESFQRFLGRFMRRL